VCPEKSEPLKSWNDNHGPALNQIKFYIHNATSIWVTDAEFHTNPSFYVRDFHFSQSALTDLGDLLIGWCHVINDHLKERLIQDWRRSDQNIIDRVVNQLCDRLRKRIRTKRATLRTSDLNSWIVSTDNNCFENSYNSAVWFKIWRVCKDKANFCESTLPHSYNS